ncbi:hypothetical protein D1818_18085 [Aquimarina sp. BL5]|uniref:zincin-like metallopeptidase toxin domain-containing protein n=1 Tax=Aquimarina sp. BL5 TaxID=1714860 RepID=UPI000E4FC0CA|nr:zincin-like metallopeptidase toxin domain-containing protein [Aquimarina sp. BL5]AXT52650.1 hypothetical protein D1818_18085 [Aquimarina sp. BL5]RKN11714.1 hypothetical protein D7036_00785 [Aquimarina sp. BL5]
MQKKTIMYAYEYGIRNFDKKYQPFPNITVFNDKIEILDENNTATTGFGIYQEITLLEDTNKAELKESGTIYPAIVVEDYLIPQEVFLNTEEQRRVDQLNREFDVFLFETKFFIHIPESNVLDEVVITAQGIGRKTKFPPRLTELNDELNQKKTSIVLFISNDGVKLERAYQKTTDILHNELVLFIEKNDKYNLFGSVIRIRSGNSISQNADLPFKDITKLARVYDLDVSRGAVLEVLQDHLQDKSSNFYFIRKALLWGSRVSKIPVNFALGKIADAMDEVSKAIENNLKIGDNYYKAYDQEGNISKTYTPILPGFNLIQTADKANENADNEQVFIQFTKILNVLEAQIQRGVDALQIDSLKKYIKRRLRVLFDVIKEAKGFIKDIIGQAIEFIKTSFVFINAFLVGIINSLVDVVKGIFDIISLICKAVVGLNNVQQNTLENPSSQFSLFMEMFENALETTVKLFTLKNIKATFVFMGKLFVRFITSPPSINITGDSLGYGIGYLIGFIVEEVVFGILTGGAKTVGTALQLAVKSYASLAKGAYKAVRKTVTMSVDTFLSLIAVIRKKLEDFPKILKDLEKWLNDVLAFVKAEAAVGAKFQGLFSLDPLSAVAIRKLGKKTIEELGKVGVKFGKNPETLKYEIQYKGLIIQSFEKEKDLVKELSEIIKKKEDDLLKYLDEQISFRKSQIDLLEDWDKIQISGRGRRRGQRLKKADIRLISKKLDELGVELELHSVNSSEVIKGFFLSKGRSVKMPKSAAAIFITDGVKMKIVLRKGATIYEFFHEFMHFRHAKELGLKRYLKLGGKGTSGELIKETFVFNKLINNRNYLTKEEIEHALWYINERIRSVFGKDPVIPSFSLDDIPTVRKQIDINKIINKK